MAYSADVVQRARARLAQAKADRESENNRHLAEAYEKVPRLREIDSQLRLTMVQAAKAVFADSSSVPAAMEQARQSNLALQREREALVKLYFEEGFLDDVPICQYCGGSGYLGTAMCECLAELCRQEQKKELGILTGGKETFAQFRLDYYSDTYDAKYGASARMVMEKNLKSCRTYASTFAPSSGNLLFVGNTGVGKTFMAACIARTVADRGYSVVYETAGRLFSKLERAKFAGDESARQEADKLYQADLLIVDDLGTEMPGQFVTAALYSILNDRLIDGKPMVITTNLNVDEAGRRYSPQIASRLYGSFTRLTFLGEDIRVLKNRGL